MVFYDYDFVEGQERLNLKGQDRLAEIMQRLPVTFFPVIIERTPSHPGLDETRRLAILSQIAHSPFPVPSERVVVGRPIARGLSAEEAARGPHPPAGTDAGGPARQLGRQLDRGGSGGGAVR